MCGYFKVAIYWAPPCGRECLCSTPTLFPLGAGLIAKHSSKQFSVSKITPITATQKFIDISGSSAARTALHAAASPVFPSRRSPSWFSSPRFEGEGSIYTALHWRASLQLAEREGSPAHPTLQGSWYWALKRIAAWLSPIQLLIPQDRFLSSHHKAISHNVPRMGSPGPASLKGPVYSITGIYTRSGTINISHYEQPPPPPWS